MEDGTEFLGRYVLAFVESTGHVSSVFERKTRKIFRQNGLVVEEVGPETWHDAATYASAVREVRAEVGEETLRQAGEEQAKRVPWEGNAETVREGLAFLAEIDRQAHRSPSGEFAGSYDFEMVAEDRVRVSVPAGVPYPVENVEGLFEGAVKTLSESPVVSLEDADTRADERAAFAVTW
ncbi:hypothetical protein RYH80_05335 [Halobaculum sp. MBLA0147]|uniref:hypothetical protein n=1 Tax=Halobaculum sp. MBLA0147 TaxID=3079934 RepID=UPI003525AF24